MMRCLHHMQLLVIIYISATTAEFEDRPPEITRFLVNDNDIKEPDSFVHVLSNTDLATNTLKCVTTNADTKKFQYRENVADSWEDQLSTTLLTVKDEGDAVEVTDGPLDGRSIVRSGLLHEWNGFYRCHTSVTVNGKTYVTLSPPVQIILPSVGAVASFEKPDPQPSLWSSYILPCVRDKATGLLPNYDDVIRYATACPGSTSSCVLTNLIQYTWEGTNGDGVPYTEHIAASQGRIRMNPRTGDLVFAYLDASDRIPKSSNSITYRLQCHVKVGQPGRVVLNDVIELNINVGTQKNYTEYEYLVPTVDDPSTNNARAKETQKCVEGQLCEVVCMFGGSAGVHGSVVGEAPDTGDNDQTQLTTKSTGFTFTPVASTSIDDWKCLLMLNNRMVATVSIPIEILNYPKLSDRTDFPLVRYLPVGEKDVLVACNAQFADSTDFFIDGQKVEVGENNGIELESNKPTQLTYKLLDLNHSGSILCASQASAGTSYATSTLIVYEPSKLTQTPEGSIAITASKENATQTQQTEFIFNCSANVDSRATVASIRWIYSKDGSDLDGKEVNVQDFKAATGLVSPVYKTGQTSISSVLTIEYTVPSDKEMRQSGWRCELEYKVLDMPEFVRVSGSEIGVTVAYEVIATPPPPPFKHWPLIGGVVGGFIFLVLLIVLINCYVQKNRGEQYYVDKKERKAGHNPEEELAEYGFSDYNRAAADDYTSSQQSLGYIDQNPVKGSRASMNYSDRPMESDTGSLDEYGDIDPGRYNEDGSFINGQYGEKNPNYSRNQADV